MLSFAGEHRALLPDKGEFERWPLFLSQMTSPEIGEAVRTAKIAVLVVGSIEQHGAHLPIDTDLTTAEYLAVEGVKAARQATGCPVALIAPSLPYGGPGLSMDEWPGTLRLRPSVLIDAVRDIGGGLAAAGFRYVLVLNGCVGNIAALTLAVQQLKLHWPTADFILLASTWAMPEVIGKVRQSGPGGLGHACELETSTALAIDPTHVHIDRAVQGVLRHPSPEVSFDFDVASPFFWPYPFGQMVADGVIGDPTVATADKGRIILEANVQRVARVLAHILDVDARRPRPSSA